MKIEFKGHSSPPLQAEIKLAGLIDNGFQSRSVAGLGERLVAAERADEDRYAKEARNILGFAISHDYKYPNNALYYNFEADFFGRFIKYKMQKNVPADKVQEIRNIYEQMRDLNPDEFALIRDPDNDVEGLFDVIHGAASKMPPEDIDMFIQGKESRQGLAYTLNNYLHWIPSRKTLHDIKTNLDKRGLLQEKTKLSFPYAEGISFNILPFSKREKEIMATNLTDYKNIVRNEVKMRSGKLGLVGTIWLKKELKRKPALEAAIRKSYEKMHSDYDDKMPILPIVLALDNAINISDSEREKIRCNETAQALIALEKIRLVANNILTESKADDFLRKNLDAPDNIMQGGLTAASKIYRLPRNERESLADNPTLYLKKSDFKALNRLEPDSLREIAILVLKKDGLDYISKPKERAGLSETLKAKLLKKVRYYGS